MLVVLFILLYFILCCISYWIYKADTLLTFLVFLSPFYFSYITFKFLDLKKIVVMPGKYKAALISGSAFFLSLILTLSLLQWLPDFVAADDLSIIIPVLLSFIPVFIINKISFIRSAAFLVFSCITCYYFILNSYFNIFLLFQKNSSLKGDAVMLSFISSYFICHTLLLMIFSFYTSRFSSKLAKCWQKNHVNAHS